MKKLQNIAEFCLSEISNVWSSNPEKHLLSAVIKGSSAKSEASLNTLELKLQEVLSEASNTPCIELSMWLRMTSSISDKLPSWNPLLATTRSLVKDREEDEEDLLIGLI